MKLKKVEEDVNGLNIGFVDQDSGTEYTLDQVISEIESNNPEFSSYDVIERSNGTRYIRSKPDGTTDNNIE